MATQAKATRTNPAATTPVATRAMAIAIIGTEQATIIQPWRWPFMAVAG